MQVINAQEENRRAACAKLAEVAQVLSDSLASVQNKLIRLATDGYNTRQRAIASLANYQSTGLLCADDVREAEALLRGEPIEKTAERERERQETKAGEDACRAMRQDLLREGLIRVPGETVKAEALCRCIIECMADVSESDLDKLYSVICEMRQLHKKGSKKRRAVAPARRQAGPTPFRVIEGGCPAEGA